VRLTTIRKRKVYWVIEGDIEGFFDHVHHKKLMSLLRQRIRDKQLLDLIWRFLRAGLMEQGLFTRTKEGTPQGGVLSPLLANIYLNRFDEWFAERAMLGNGHARTRHRKAGHANFQMVRYADDFLVFSNGTKLETEAFKAEMKAWLADELKLTLSEEKTAITHYTDGVNFLGFTLKKTPSRKSGQEVVVNYPSTDSVQRAVQHITALTRRTDVYKSREDKIEALNRFLHGWGEYFRHSSGSGALSYVEHHTYMRMWKWLIGKEGVQHGWRRVKAKYAKDQTWQVGKHRLFRLRELKIEYPTLHKPSNPFLSTDPVPEPFVVDLYAAAWTGYNDYGWDWKPARDAVWMEAEGRCAICGDPAEDVHHIKARKKGGGNVRTNLVTLCRLHHQAVTRRNSAASQQIASEAKPDSGELGAWKRARPVRGEGL
jgi:RNA-directed DNA polymerase